VNERQPVTASDGDRYARAAGRVMARSAILQGTIADQQAGDAVAALGLLRVAVLAEALGRPQDALTIVHVAGTKGKGSTVAFLSAMLVAGGHRTGRYTSPHLAKLTERITIDEVDLDDATFADLTDRIIGAAEAIERDRPDLGGANALEILFVMALLAFREAGCRVAVIEVGIGGRLDTTNIVDPAVSIITTLDLEHTAILGDTLAQIAAEKAGIIKPGRPVVVAPQPDEAMTVIRAQAEALGSQLTQIEAPSGVSPIATSALRGEHQRLNAALALAALDVLADREPGLAVEPDQRRLGERRAWLPGRFEVVRPIVVRKALGGDTDLQAPLIVLDGAHTPRAAAALRSTLTGGAPPGGHSGEVIVCGFAADKDVRAFLVALGPSRILPVTAASPRAVQREQIARIAGDLGIVVLDGPATVGDGLRWLIGRQLAVRQIVVTGSFLVVAEARVALELTGYGE